jgi:hypothetical protein
MKMADFASTFMKEFSKLAAVPYCCLLRFWERFLKTFLFLALGFPGFGSNLKSTCFL